MQFRQVTEKGLWQLLHLVAYRCNNVPHLEQV
jgi:hypothetical protein